jgi:RNA polymerase sigma-70 factor, ECF subfamily
MTETKEAKHQIPDPALWVDEYGDYLYRYALQRTRSTQLAEDMVQETFLAALKSKDRFSGKSSVKTWLIGILKHKIIDHIRKNSKEQTVSELSSDDQAIDDLFDKGGHWKKPPSDWNADPSELLERGEFWQVFEDCVGRLPSQQADAFTMREIEDTKTEEICKVLSITPTNLWVSLHRARARLRKCLEENWFNG